MDQLETISKYVDGVEADLTTPDPAILRTELARRHHQRNLALRVGTVVLVTLVGIGAIVAATRDDPAQVATQDGRSAAAGADIDTTTTLPPDAPSLRSILVDTVNWRPVSRSGIPGPSEGSIDSEEVRFIAGDDEDTITFFHGCANVTVRAIEWGDTGFRILGPPPGGTGADGCLLLEDDAIHRTPVPVGLDVLVELDYDAALLTLRSQDPSWELTLVGGVRRDDGSASDWADVFLPADAEPTAELPMTEAQETLVAGHRWLVLSREGIPEPAEGSHEELIFLSSPDRLILSNCDLSIHSVEWTEQGFVVGDEIPGFEDASAIDCPEDQGGILNIAAGATVQVEVGADGPGSVSLSSADWSLLTRSRSLSDAAPESEQDLELLAFLAPLERGRWKLAAGSDSYPDRSELDQGIAFWTLKEAGDRMILYGKPCFGTQVFLQWTEPGIAVVTEDRSGIKFVTPSIRCDPSPGIANHPPPIGSTITVEGDRDFIDVTLFNRDGSEEWSARFEYHQYHLLEDQ